MWDPGERRRPSWRPDAGEEQSPEEDGQVLPAGTEAAAAEEPAAPEEPASLEEPAAPEKPALIERSRSPLQAWDSMGPSTGMAEAVEAAPPPSLSFDVFIELLDAMSEHGLPNLLHEEYFSDRPGPVRAQFIAALRFFGLIDDQGQPLPRLILLMDDVARRRILLQLLSTHYVRPMGIGFDANPADVEAWFQEQGLEDPRPRRRAIAFLIDAADYAGMQVPGVTDDRARAEFRLAADEAEAGDEAGEPADEVSAVRPSPGRLHADSAAPAPEEAGGPPLPEHTLEAKRSAYVDLLMDLVKASGDHPDEKLLDRIERVLAYPTDDADDADESAEPEPEPASPRPARAGTAKRASRTKRQG